jgi:hypothetical protein
MADGEVENPHFRQQTRVPLYNSVVPYPIDTAPTLVQVLLVG